LPENKLAAGSGALPGPVVLHQLMLVKFGRHLHTQENSNQYPKIIAYTAKASVE
jgi:hypothetical protein